MIEHDSGTAFGNSFEIQALSSPQTETVFNYLLPDNDGVDDFLKSLHKKHVVMYSFLSRCVNFQYQ